MNDFTIPTSEKQQNTEPQADLVIRLPGNDHHVSADVLFSHLRMALKDVTFKGGYVDVSIDHSGRVYIDKRLVYTPKSLIGKVGAA